MEEGKVNPNINDPFGWPLLNRLSFFRNNEMIELYLSKGGDLHIVHANFKWNALHYSSYYGNLETTKYLVSIGVDYKAKNITNKTPTDLAKEAERFEVFQFLQQVENK